jgi:O-antigen ligase
MPELLTKFLGDRIQINSLLIVLCFVSVLALSSQSAASYPSYLLALSMLLAVRSWNDVFATRMIWIVVGLVGYLCVSTFWSDPFSWRKVFGIFGRGLLVFTFVVALAECQLRGQVQLWLGRALAIVGMGAAMAAMTGYFLNSPPGSRLSGLGQLDNPVVVGLIMGAVLILLVDIVLADPSRRWRAAAVAGAVTVALAIFLSGSRNAWISSCIGLLVLLYARRIKDPQRFVAAFMALLIVMSAILLAMMMSDTSRDLLLPRGDSFRLGIWSEVLSRVTKDAPLIGLGIGTPDQVRLGNEIFSHPHNMYLAVYFQGGLLALLLFWVLIVWCLSVLFKSYAARNAKLALGLLSMALASYLFDGHELVDKVGETWFLFWLPVSMALGLSWSRSWTPNQVESD